MGVFYDRTSRFLFAVNTTVDGAVAAAKTVICLGSNVLGAIKNPKALLGALGSLASGIAVGLAASVTSLISAHINRTINSALSPLRIVQQKIAEFTAIAGALLATIENIKQEAADFERFLKNRQECAAQGAQLLNCVAQVISNKITPKALISIDNKLNEVHNSVMDTLMGNDGLLSQHVERHNYFVTKAQNQIKFLT
jgi:phage-related minor tail protein